MEYKKISDTEIQAISQKTETNTYDINSLRQQKLDILNQKREFVKARNEEIEEVNDLIAQCKKLGIQSKLEVAETEDVTVK